MDSIHQDYLDGEEVYAGKLDTLKVRPGYYRAQLEGQTQFLGNSTQIIIEYDNELEIYDIINENISDGIYSMILPNLDGSLSLLLQLKMKLVIFRFLRL